VKPGEIYAHDRFYRDRTDGQFKRKFILVLAVPKGRDLVARLLTSRAHGRPEAPPCFHGDPYPGYYLGVLGGSLSAKSWVDLRGLDDLDVDEFGVVLKKGYAQLVTSIQPSVLAEVLDCAARADDTTRLQETLIRDTLANLK